jgi:hypothetical protein
MQKKLKLSDIGMPDYDGFKLRVIEMHCEEILAYIRQQRKRICRRQANTTGR